MALYLQGMVEVDWGTGDWGLGTGDWGLGTWGLGDLGTGDWGLGDLGTWGLGESLIFFVHNHICSKLDTNVLWWKGDLVKTELDDQGVAIANLNRELHQDKRVTISIVIPINFLMVVLY